MRFMRPVSGCYYEHLMVKYLTHEINENTGLEQLMNYDSDLLDKVELKCFYLGLCV